MQNFPIHFVTNFSNCKLHSQFFQPKIFHHHFILAQINPPQSQPNTKLKNTQFLLFSFSFSQTFALGRAPGIFWLDSHGSLLQNASANVSEIIVCRSSAPFCRFFPSSSRLGNFQVYFESWKGEQEKKRREWRRNQLEPWRSINSPDSLFRGRRKASFASFRAPDVNSCRGNFAARSSVKASSREPPFGPFFFFTFEARKNENLKVESVVAIGCFFTIVFGAFVLLFNIFLL